MTKNIQLPLVISLTLFLAACASTPSDHVGTLPSDRQSDLNKTLQQADKKKGSEALSLYLAAADLAWQQGNALRARTLLEAQNLSQATPAQQIFAHTLAAELAMARQQAAAALQLLNDPVFARLSELPVQQQARTHLVKAQALEATQRPLAAAQERIFAAAFLTDRAAADNHERIWALVSQLPSQQLGHSREFDLNGWLTLAALTRSSHSLAQKQQDVQRWVIQNPQHPAARQLPQPLQKLLTLHAQPLQRIALLLPSQDRNQAVVDAIRNGFLSMYYSAQAQQQATPELRMYDSSQITSMATLYQQLQHDEIDLLIGPWEKNWVRELAEQHTLPIPTLALNYADQQQTATNLYQFGLAAEDEARQAADHAWADGMRHAALLIQDGEWGRRVQAAFAERWHALGGTIVDTQYINKPIELAQQIATLFHLRESEERSKKLAETLGTKLYSQPGRRRDIDFIFLAAPPQQARAVKPALTFQYAGNVPVYATSAANPGSQDPSLMHDLDGIQLSEVPWLLEEHNPVRDDIIARWPEAQGLMGRFYAMGADAYQLATQLQLLSTLPNSTSEGFTGILQLNALQHVERQTPWARFEQGKLQPVRQDELK